MQERYLELDKERKIHYLYWENPGKPKILFLHGITANAGYFEDIFGFFKKNYEIYATDFAGHNKSYVKSGYYPLEDYIQDTYDFYNTLIKEKCFIIGYSMGGRVALWMTIEHPEIAEKLVIVDVAPDIDPEGLDMLIKAHKALPEYFKNYDDLKNYLRKYRGIVNDNYLKVQMKHYWKKNNDGNLVPNYDRDIWNVTLEKVHEECSYIKKGVPSITVPVLIIRGEYSMLLSRKDAESFAAMLKHGKLVEIAGTTHGVFSEESEKCSAIINRFLVTPS